jgi:predicted transcriptional regulator
MRSGSATFSADADNSETDQNAGSNMADILTLSPRQQQIINWIMRQREVTIEEIAAYIEARLQETRDEVTTLINQGFIETRQNQGITYYAIDFRFQQNNDDALGKVSSASTAIRPLSIILNPSGTVSIATGESFELCVTVTNQGDLSAVISVAIDKDPSSIYPWCRVPSESLALSVGQSCEVVFRIEIPPTTLPDDYKYTLIIDAPNHYPEHTPIQYKGRVIVEAAVQEVVRANDPTFITSPRSSSKNPHQMRSGETWQILVAVANRSERVDRFQLTVPDLDPKWFSIYYPEGLALAGIVEAAEGLPLNPDSQGQITLILKPPIDIWAGVYSPTIRIHSDNNPDLGLLDILYFEILPTYQLDIQLITLATKKVNQPSIYEMRLRSYGNILRSLSFKPSSSEQEGLLIYNLANEEIAISPFGVAKINIEVATTKKCKPNFLSDRYLSFTIEVSDQQEIVLANDRYVSNVIVPSRPWWQLVLVIIGILGIIGTAIFLIWWFFFRPPDVPKILEFTSESSTYQESANEAIRLRWRISHPEILREIKVEGLSTDDKILSQSVVYNFTKGIPPELKEFCVIDRDLLCQNIPTDARKPSQYVFQMNISSQNPKTGTIPLAKTTKILVEPIPQAEILEFAPTKPLYTESKPAIASPPAAKPSAKPNVTEPNITESNITEPNGIDPNLPIALNPDVAIANPEPAPKNTQIAQINKTETLILAALGIAGGGAKPEIIEAKPDLGDEIRLNWRISNINQVKGLTLIGRSPEGEVKSPPLQFSLSEGLPAALSPYCAIANDQMICKNVPTQAKVSSSYVFELAIVPTKPSADPKAIPNSRKTEISKILAYPPKILELKVNGQDSLPQYFFNLNPNIPTMLTVSWKVEASATAKIDLLPAPGNVAAVGQLSIPLTPKSGEVTYTLLVTNPDGQVVMRSFIVQTIAPPPIVPKPEEVPPIPF